MTTEEIKNELKKSLYRDNPIATFQGVDKYGIQYVSTLNNGKIIRFTVPLNPDEIGESRFGSTQQGKHLVRYISAWEF